MVKEKKQAATKEKKDAALLSVFATVIISKRINKLGIGG